VAVAITQLAHWRAQRWDVCINVNLSGEDLSDSALVTFTLEQLHAHDLEPALLNFEVSYADVANNWRQACANLAAFRQAGLGLVIDNFVADDQSEPIIGEGEWRAVKMNRQSLTAMLRSNVAAQQVMHGLRVLSRFDQLVVAQGVHSFHHYERLRKLDFGRLQGFYFCPPQNANELERWFRVSANRPAQLTGRAERPSQLSPAPLELTQ
jgi:cyclic di-GMP phosphodiesterase Gmr